jgi:ABC-type glutathione transport system ATPase component
MPVPFCGDRRFGATWGAGGRIAKPERSRGPGSEASLGRSVVSVSGSGVAARVLTLADVGRRFPGGVEALIGVSLKLQPHDFVALLGPSGCGKSTLLRLIAGLDQPDAGYMRWDDGHEPGPGEIGYVFQDATLLPWASAAENVYLPLRLRGRSWADAAADVSAALDHPNSPAACGCECRSPAPWSPARGCC